MTDTKDTLNEIIDSQVVWADTHGIPHRGSNMCQAVGDNLFVAMNADTAAEFGTGAGDELGTDDAPGSMASLRSSSALAVNVFDAWRGDDLAPLASLLGADRLANRLRFEAQHPTGLGGIPPHLDVVIDSEGGSPLAIESKFTEIYSPAHNGFRESYFQKLGLWYGFDHVRDIAIAVADGSEKFEHLGVAQLIKHALGLKNAHGPRGFRLLYLWYEWPSAIADAHVDELSRFARVARLDFEIESLTYQEMFQRLQNVDEPQHGYLSYLRDRYLAGD
jgi:hypothetical protein